MKLPRLSGLLLLLLFNFQVYAFDTVDEQIDHYLSIFENGNYDSKTQMLERLQWSGLSDPRLFDKIAEEPESEYLRNDLGRKTAGIFTYQVRALGYSGNEKYRELLERIGKSAGSPRVKKHARKALKELPQHGRWNRLIAESDLDVSGKSVEVVTYMKMLSTDDIPLQRMAARAIFHEKRNDPDLLAMMAERLKASYLQQGLDKVQSDTLAWFCKALGENDYLKYKDLLVDVVANTPYKNVRRHARKYTK